MSLYLSYCLRQLFIPIDFEIAPAICAKRINNTGPMQFQAIRADVIAIKFIDRMDD